MDRRRHKTLAIYNFAVAMIAGGFTGQVMAGPMHSIFAAGIEVNHIQIRANWPCSAFSASLGFLWNLLSPTISRRLIKAAETWSPKV